MNDYSPSALWTVTTESFGEGLTLSLTNDAVMVLSDAEGTSLWTVSGSFDDVDGDGGTDFDTIAVDTDTDTVDSHNGGDAANSGTTAVDEEHHTNQWWFWMMLFVTITVIVVVAVFKFSKKESKVK